LPSAIASHLPLDLVIVMLGTNDTKSFFQRTPYDIANGMAKLVGQILTSAGGVGTPYPAPKALVIAPPPLKPMPHPFFQGMFEGGHEKTLALAGQYRAMADFMKVDFLNAGDFAATDGCDGIHFVTENNHDLGNVVAARSKRISHTNQPRPPRSSNNTGCFWTTHDKRSSCVRRRDIGGP
jgi:lysophospholipase L1-like esterase